MTRPHHRSRPTEAVATLRRRALPAALAIALGTAASLAWQLPVGAVEGATAGPVAPLAAPAGPPGFADVAERVTPAVVNVTVIQQAPQRLSLPRGSLPGVPEDSPLYEFFRQFSEQFGGLEQMPRAPAREGEGSGFIIDPTGVIVTNNHVIENADRIEVTLNDGSTFKASVIGRDPKTDIAVLKIDSNRPLPYVSLGSSAQARIGDWVLAVGNPFGLGGSVNAGIISARGRDISSGPYDDYLQIDAPINRGNSGGPLFDARGNVIGVNTAIFSPSGGNIGIGFAIPAETVASVVQELRTKGYVERGWLGVQIQSVTEEVAASLGLPESHGVLVADVLPDGPAAAAGVRNGDVIRRAHGQAVKEARDLTRLIAGIKAGTRIELTIYRDGREIKVPVTIGQMPQEKTADAGPQAPSAEPGPRLGLKLAPLTPEARAERGLPDGASGVLVTEVTPGSPAARAGIEPGSLISMVGQQPVTSPEQVTAAVREAAKQSRPSVLLRVESDGQQRFVAVPFG